MSDVTADTSSQHSIQLPSPTFQAAVDLGNEKRLRGFLQGKLELFSDEHGIDDVKYVYILRVENKRETP